MCVPLIGISRLGQQEIDLLCKLVRHWNVSVEVSNKYFRGVWVELHDGLYDEAQFQVRDCFLLRTAVVVDEYELYILVINFGRAANALCISCPEIR